MIEYQLEYLFLLVVAAISGEPSLKEDELSDDAPAEIGTDAAAILGDEDASDALEGSEEKDQRN